MKTTASKACNLIAKDLQEEHLHTASLMVKDGYCLGPSAPPGILESIHDEMLGSPMPTKHATLFSEMLRAIGRGEPGASEAVVNAFRVWEEQQCFECAEATWSDGRHCAECRERESEEIQDIQDPPEG